MKYLKLYESIKESKSFQDLLYNRYGKDLNWNLIDSMYCKEENIIDLKGIEKLINLKELNVDSNKNLTNIKGIEKLIHLENFHCDLVPLTNLSEIKNLIKLNHVECGCELNDLKDFTNLINMTHLDARGNNITSLQGIEKLSKLSYLNVCHCQLKNLDELLIFDLPNLEGVYAYNNPYEYPVNPIIIKKFNMSELYEDEQLEYFKTYECQKEFLTKFPERLKELEEFGIHEKIKEEFADIIEGNEFGFFNLR